MKTNTQIKPIDYLDTQNIFFTSDFHVGHSNVIKFDKRPFHDVNEMSETLIRNWNNVVSDNDIIYYLGDLSYRVRSDYTKWFVNQLNGDIRVILGNHDRLQDLIKLDRFSDIQSYKRLEVKETDTNGKEFHQVIILSHYAHLVWDKCHYSSWHLHGHSHQSIFNSDFGKETYYKRKVIDVGCNGHDYTPLSYQQIKDIMIEKKDSTHH